jgi:hypothetical protein
MAADRESSTGVQYWSHGLISDSAYESSTSICNYSQIERQQNMGGSLTPVCSKVISQFSREIGDFIDGYDVTLDVCLPSLLSQSEVLNQLVRIGFFSYTFCLHCLPQNLYGNSGFLCFICILTFSSPICSKTHRK